MDRRRHTADEAERWQRRLASEAPKRRSSVADAVLELHAAVGNRGVGDILGRATVQRQPAKPAPNDGGALTLGSEEAIPLQSATWSLKVGVALSTAGARRTPELVPTTKAGELMVTRTGDAQSGRMADLLGTPYERGSLRLDRPSRDGALPAVTLALRDVSVASYGRTKGDNPVETISVAVGDLQVAGMDKEASSATAVAELKIGAGQDSWPPLPVISWHREEAPADIVGSGLGRKVQKSERPTRLTVKLGTGMGLTRLAEALDKQTRLNVTLSPKRGGSEVTLQEAIVETVKSSADGPNVVEVGFVAAP